MHHQMDMLSTKILFGSNSAFCHTADGIPIQNVSLILRIRNLIVNIVLEENEAIELPESQRNGWFGRRRRSTDMDSLKQAVEKKVETLQQNLEIGDAKVETTTEVEIVQVSKSDEPAAASCESGFELQK